MIQAVGEPVAVLTGGEVEDVWIHEVNEQEAVFVPVIAQPRQRPVDLCLGDVSAVVLPVRVAVRHPQQRGEVDVGDDASGGEAGL